MTDTTNKEKVVNMCKVKIFVAAGVCLILSVLVVLGTIASKKGRKYGRIR